MTRRADRSGPALPGAEVAVQPRRRRTRAAVRLGLRERARLRRRVRFLRKQRELQLRDLGGLIFDMYRFASKRQDLVRDKLQAMFAADRELRQFEHMLGRRTPLDVREPGVGGACPHCLRLFATDAHFCSNCGLALAGEAEQETIIDAPPGPAPEAYEPETAEPPPDPPHAAPGPEPDPQPAAVVPDPAEEEQR